MRLLTFFTTLLLAGLACSAPTSNDDIMVINEDFFPASLAIYTAEHDIVNILVPLNGLNFKDDDADNNEESVSDKTIFIVEADTDANGERIDQGLYLMKGGHATKLLDNGRDVAAANDDSKTAYFAAKDGLYVYDVKKNKAEKYGTVTDDLLSIAKVNGSDIIYVLTNDHILYKVTEEGTKKEKVDAVVNAKKIVLDYQNNLYYYTTDKQVYALVGDSVKKIEGLPENPTSVDILKPPLILENGIPVVVDNKSYIVYENGTSEQGEFEFAVKPTAYSMEAIFIQYYAYNKKIYEYNILSLVLSEVITDLKEFLENKIDDIRSIATRSRAKISTK